MILLINYSVILCLKKWHPDKQKDQDSSTSRFQDINEAYQGQFFIFIIFIIFIG